MEHLHQGLERHFAPPTALGGMTSVRVAGATLALPGLADIEQDMLDMRVAARISAVPCRTPRPRITPVLRYAFNRGSRFSGQVKEKLVKSDQFPGSGSTQPPRATIISCLDQVRS